jgi:hypothetical protein
MRPTTCLLALALTACAVTPPPVDDAGDAAWVMAAVPTLLGRPAKSTLELEALTDLTVTHGREHVARLLMGRPEFDRYWAMVLLESMRLDSQGWYGLDPNCLYPQDSQYRYPADFHAGMDTQTAIPILQRVSATTVRTPTDVGAPLPSVPAADATFTKLLEAAVHGDRLDLAYGAFLPILAAAGDDADNLGNLREQWNDKLLDRRIECLSCHSGTWSVTDDALLANQTAGGWDRTFLPGGAMIEGALFDWDDNGTRRDGSRGGWRVAVNQSALFDKAQWGPTQQGVFGLDPRCFTRPTAGHQWLDVTRDHTNSPVSQVDAHFAGLDGAVTVIDLTEAFLTAAPDAHLAATATRPYVPPGPPQTFDPLFYPISGCTSCHQSPLDPGFAHIPDDRIRAVLKGDGPPEMDLYDCTVIFPGNLDACADGMLRQIRAQVPYQPPVEYTERDRAFALAVAWNIVEDVVHEVGGIGLSLSHGHPRTDMAAFVQHELAVTLTSSGWSLREVLVQILLSEGFNRNAPAESTQEYVLPQLAKPFARLQPGSSPDPKDNAASMGDAVHRQSITRLTEKLHHALGWPTLWTRGNDLPNSTPDAIYPSPSMLRALGRYDSLNTPGWDDPILPGLLEWEHQVGTCDKPIFGIPAPDMDQTPISIPFVYGDYGGIEWTRDWIDHLVADAVANSWTVEDTMRLLKERLLNDPTLPEAEKAALHSLFTGHISPGLVIPGEDDWIGEMLASDAGAPLEGALRDYCGALITSPQFVLGGVSAVEASDALVAGASLPARPAFERPGPLRGSDDPMEPRTFLEWCQDYGYQPNAGGVCALPWYPTIDPHPGDLTPM